MVNKYRFEENVVWFENRITKQHQNIVSGLFQGKSRHEERLKWYT